MPIRRKPNARIRARQARAAELYLAGNTYASVAETLGYANESCARAAVRQWLGRQDQAAGDERRIMAARLEAIVTSYIGDALGGDAEAARVAMTAERDKARLLGVNREQGAGSGISAGDFAVQLMQIVEIVPDAARFVRSLPDELTALLPSADRERLLGPEEPVQHRSPAEDGWANISAEDVGGPHREPGGYQPYGGTPESPSEWRTEPFPTDPEPHDDQDDGEEVVEVVAELIPLPPAQRRVKAPIDSNGVPYDRGGIHRRLPGPSSRHYNPLGYSGWTQIIHPADD